MLKAIKYIIFLGLIASCGVQFVPQTLDSQLDNTMNYQAMKIEHTEALKDFSSTEIYTNTTSDEVWGMESDACHNFHFTEEIVYEGERAIQLEWNTKDKDCDWIGMGIGWDGWSGKSIGDIMFSSAIELKIRSIKGESLELPIIVFLLEDYSNTNLAVGIQNQFLERSVIDENWQSITIPLYLFNFDNAEGDAFNVKQLKLELQGAGAVVIDDIKIVPYETNVADLAKVYDPKEEKDYKSPFKKFKASEIFAGDMSTVWGAEKDACKNIVAEPNDAITSNALNIKWNNEDQRACKWIGMGFSWDNFNAKDLTPVLKTAAIEMSVKAPKGKTLYSIPIVALLEDYNGKQCATLPKSINFSNPPFTNEWQKIYLPLTDFDYEKIGVDMSNIKQLIFQFLGSGALLIDDVKLVPYTAPSETEPKKYYAKDQFPITIFDNGFRNNSAWGFVKTNCRDFHIEASTGIKKLNLIWDFSNDVCKNKSFGVSWANWEAINFEELKGDESIQIYVTEINGAILSIGFENYTGQRSHVKVDKNNIQNVGNGYLIKIPIQTILAQKDFNIKNIKQVLFSFEGKGTLEIHKIIIQ